MTPERKRLAILLGVLVVIAVLSFWPSSREEGPARPARREVVRHGAASRTATYTVETIPTVVPLSSGGRAESPVVRNVFAFATPTPPPTPKPPPPTPTPLPRMGDARFVGPVPSPPPATPTPIIPPPIPYKIVGVFGPPGQLIVALEDNGRLINARAGDILDGRFTIRKINRESVDFGFTGLPPEITRRLPIAQ